MFRDMRVVSAFLLGFGCCAAGIVFLHAGQPRAVLPPASTTAPTTTRPHETDTAHPRAEPLRAQRYLMGAPWAITLPLPEGKSDVEGNAAMTAAFDEVARIETFVSEWRRESEISRVNDNAGVAPVSIGNDLRDCVAASLAVSTWSDGAYDISWAGLRGLWDFSETSAHRPPSRAEVQRLLPLWNYRNIVLDTEHNTLFLLRTGMQIGLGGIAKGYALDRAGALLIERGFANFLIFGGGQVLTHGRCDGRAWRVGLQHPREPRYFAFVEIENASVATSGDYEHAYEYEGQIYHHILDPHTGFPARGLTSVTVVAPTALTADAVDTALFVLGKERALAAMPSAPGGPIDAVLVDDQVRMTATGNLRSRLVLRAEIAQDGTIGAPLAEE